MTAPPAGRRPRDSWLFLLLVYLGLQLYLWVVVPTRYVPAIVAGAVPILAVLIGDPIRRGETADSVGLTGRHIRRAAIIALPMTLGAAIVLLLVNQFSGAGAPDWSRFGRRALAILPWALLQQGMLQATFNRRIVAARGPGWSSALLVGFAFAGMHLPNPFLTGLTLVAGTAWARLYQSAPNLWILVLSHTLLSAAAQTTLPSAWTHGFRVGPGWFRWHP